MVISIFQPKSLKIIIHHVIVVLLVMEIIVWLRIAPRSPFIPGAMTADAIIINIIVSVMLVGAIKAFIIAHEYIQIIEIFGIAGIIN